MGCKWGAACPAGKHIFVCSLHPSDLPSITTPGAIWGHGVVGEQDHPAQFGPFLQTPQHPQRPSHCQGLFPSPGAEATAKPGRVRGGSGDKLKTSFVGHLSLAPEGRGGQSLSCTIAGTGPAARSVSSLYWPLLGAFTPPQICLCNTRERS